MMNSPETIAIALMGLGLLLLAIEALIPGFGVVGLTGLLALMAGFTLGLVTLWPLQALPAMLVIGAGLALAVLVLLLIIMFWRSRRHPVTTGKTALIGQSCTALEDFASHGRVWLHGEAWQAISNTPVTRGQQLTVTAIHGLTVYIQDSTCNRQL